LDALPGCRTVGAPVVQAQASSPVLAEMWARAKKEWD